MGLLILLYEHLATLYWILLIVTSLVIGRLLTYRPMHKKTTSLPKKDVIHLIPIIGSLRNALRYPYFRRIEFVNAAIQCLHLVLYITAYAHIGLHNWIFFLLPSLTLLTMMWKSCILEGFLDRLYVLVFLIVSILFVISPIYMFSYSVRLSRIENAIGFIVFLPIVAYVIYINKGVEQEKIENIYYTLLFLSLGLVLGFQLILLLVFSTALITIFGMLTYSIMRKRPKSDLFYRVLFPTTLFVLIYGIDLLAVIHKLIV